MDKNLEATLRNIFFRSLSPVQVQAKETLETVLEHEGRKREADVFEAVFRGGVFRLYIREITIHRTFFRNEEVYRTYELNRRKVPAFSCADVLRLLSDCGYAVPGSLLSMRKDDFTIEKTVLKRTEEGRKAFYRNLRDFGILGLRLVLEYDPGNEGSFSLTLMLKSEDEVDTGSLKRLDLGIRDYGKEIGRDKKRALIRYLGLLSSFSMHAGLDRVDLIDYFTLVEAMQQHSGSEPFKMAIEKGRSDFAKKNPSFGGEGYASYGMSLTPLDFAWYADGFDDTDAQRKVFFDFYDSLAGSGMDAGNDERLRHLKVLGLSSEATEEEIKNAYRNKVMSFHPDRIQAYKLDPAFMEFANKEMQKANEAYAFLTGGR